MTMIRSGVDAKTPAGWEPLQHFMLRTSLLSFGAVYHTPNQEERKSEHVSPAAIRNAAASRSAEDQVGAAWIAIAASSPQLVQALLRGEPSAADATQRYLLRMASRPTPYGLMAQTCVGKVDDAALQSDLALGGVESVRMCPHLEREAELEFLRTARRDLSALPQAVFVRNPTLVQRRLRYEWWSDSVTGASRTRCLRTALTDAIFEVAQLPTSLDELVRRAAPNVEQQDLAVATKTFRRLIELEALVPCVGDEIDGGGLLRALGALSPAIFAAGAASSSHVVTSGAIELMEKHQGSDFLKWERANEEILATLRGQELPPNSLPHALKHPVYWTSHRTEQPVLSGADAALLLRAAERLAAIAWRGSGVQYERCREAFARRFDTDAVPLSDAAEWCMSPDTGRAIGENFPRRESSGDSRRLAAEDLLEDVVQAWLLEDGSAPVNLSSDAIQSLSRTVPSLPPSVGAIHGSIVVDATGERQQRRGYVRSVVLGGGTATVGRFSIEYAAAAELLDSIRRSEQALLDPVITAEVAWIPHARTGNIARRALGSRPRIAIGSWCTSDDGLSLPVSDLYVVNRPDRLVLFSRSRNREVVPRFASALHPRLVTHPIVRFLHAIQFAREEGSIFWDWGKLKTRDRLPRIQIGDSILAPATWSLRSALLRAKSSGDGLGATRELLERLRTSWRLPRTVMLQSGEEQVLLDLEDVRCIRLLIRETRGSSSVTLCEALTTPNSSVVQGSGAPMAFELVLPVRIAGSEAAPTHHRPALPMPGSLPTTRRWPSQPFTGSRWLYVRVGCHDRDANEILRTCVWPVAQEYTANGMLRQWHFVRLGGEEFELRVRVKAATVADLRTIGDDLLDRLAAAEDDGLLADLALRRYKPEYSRYGGEFGVSLAQELSTLDSNLAMHLQASEASRKERDRDALAALLVSSTLRHFLSEDEALRTWTRSWAAAQRSSVAASESKRIQVRVRECMPKLYALVAGGRGDASRPSAGDQTPPLWSAIAERDLGVADVARRFQLGRDGNRFTLTADSWLSASVHMAINKFYARDTRAAECTIAEALRQLMRAAPTLETAAR